LAQGRNFFNIQKKFSAEEKLNKGNCVLCRVADPHHFNADPDPIFLLKYGSGYDFSLHCGSGARFSSK
jgi:hypothetical protein